MKELVYKKSEHIGFVFYPKKFGEKFAEIDKSKTMFIGFSDFENILLDHVKSVFPLEDPETKQVEENFDVCSSNYIHKEAWKQIIARVKEDKNSAESLSSFKESFCEYISEQLERVDEIIVYGTI